MNQAIDPKPRFLDIEGVVNFRDIGGYAAHNGRSVRWGKVYRAGQLDKPTCRGIECLKELKISTVVDLRYKEETQRYPTCWQGLPDVRVLEWQQFYSVQQTSQDALADVPISWREALETGQPQTVREAMRVNYPFKLYSHRGVYKAMLDSLIGGHTPLVFHCAAGKDRTGVGAALILGLLGVSRDDIIEDYLLTQQETAKLYERFRAGGATNNEEHEDFQQRLANYPQELVAPVFEADPDYIATLLDYVADRYQSFDAYAQKILGFTAAQQEQLKAELLES